LDIKKILITGKNNAIIEDCFNQMQDNYMLISTSLRYDDMDRHLSIFEPDVLLICLNGETRDEYNRIIELKRKLTRMDTAVAIVGDPLAIEEFQKIAVYMADIVMEKPITVSLIKQNLSEYYIEKKKRAEEEKRIQQEIAKIKEQERRKKVLVIDDDPAMLRIIKEHLHEKYDVATAISGKIAYKFLECKETDLILLDFEMPVEKGPEVFVNIRKNERYENTPVVFLTGIRDREKINEALMLKPQGYLLKPIDKEKLIGTIEKFLG